MPWTAPHIPARLPGWEHAYAQMIEQQAAIPFAWGRADCLTRVADLCAAMTGVNPLPASLRRYSTANGAQRVLERLGFNTVDDALSAVFEEIPRAKARRGDCGIAEVRNGGEVVLTTLIVMGATAMGSNDRGPVAVPTLMLKKTFRIG